ncbi:hypothetical protein Q9Q94_09950 [Uliginosibacterium sp. 31-16]|uniref:hypothetical protein n=1 Tax=Uliginosibacterium sp. 31-16 TaxID=3068315 RepID=UPI00273D7EDA|nr:hypothetical protein [Uliginosibacterium sp. 31-16]MDP5239856.1 hypothetical protein [Uliginosibacterium sp. 31-16]
MNPKLRKTLKVATIAFAAIGIFLCVVIALAMLSDRNKSAELDADTRLLTDIYAGTGTRFGLVSRYVDTVMNRPTVHHQLLQLLAHEDSPDGKRQLLVIGYREMRPEISTKIETGSVDIAKMAAAGTLDMLVDVENTAWYVMASLREKKNGEWVEVASQSGILPGELGETPPVVSFPKLSAKQAGFSLRNSSGEEQYYQRQGQDFVSVLHLTTRLDDLDSCLAYRSEKRAEETAASESAAEKARQAASAPASEENAEAEDEEGMVETEPDFWCVKASLQVNRLDSISHGYHDIEVLAEGEGAARQPMKKRYMLRYMPRYKVYGFGEGPNHTALSDVMSDFAAALP